MTFRAVYRDGEVVLPADADIPDGARLDVRVVREKRTKGAKAGNQKKRARRGSSGGGTLADRLRSVIGKAKGLPADASRNIDHYLYGARKR